eukprot:389473_1
MMVKPVDDTTFVAIIYTSLAVGTLMLMILLFCFVKNILLIHKSQGDIKTVTIPIICNMKITKIAKYLAIMSVSGYILCNACWISYWSLLLGYTPVRSIIKQTNLLSTSHALSILFWCIGCLSFLSVVIFRLYTIFHGTKYQSSKYVFFIYGVLLFILLLMYLSFIIDRYTDSINDNLFNNILFPSLIIFNLLIGISLMYLFGNKLFKLANEINNTVHISESKARTNSPKYEQIDNKYECESDPKYIKQINLLKIICKNTLLSFLALFPIQIYLCFQWTELYFKNNYEWNVWSYFLCCRWILRSIAMFIETLCLYLMLIDNNNLYNLLKCNKCQNILQKCCENVIKKENDKMYKTKTIRKCIGEHTEDTVTDSSECVDIERNTINLEDELTTTYHCYSHINDSRQLVELT